MSSLGLCQCKCFSRRYVSWSARLAELRLRSTTLVPVGRKQRSPSKHIQAAVQQARAACKHKSNPQHARPPAQATEDAHHGGILLCGFCDAEADLVQESVTLLTQSAHTRVAVVKHYVGCSLASYLRDGSGTELASPAGAGLSTGRIAYLYGESLPYAASMNMFLLELGLSPAIIAGSQPGHMDMKLGDIMTGISTAHMAMHGMHLPLQLLEPPPSLSEARLVMNVVLDQGNVPTPSGDLRQDESHVVVLDSMCSESERQELLGWLTAPDHDHSGPPPEDKWELGCVDRMGDEPTWGLQTHMLQALRDDPPPALRAVHSRLAQLYPEFEMCHMPADALEGEHEDETGLSSFVANAVMPGDPAAWHVDADPSALPPSSPWVEHFGWYVNREPGRPLFVSVLLYLNDAWPEEFHAETLFLDHATQTGVFSRPAPGRMVLMDQDMPHRISVPSTCASGPRYSLVWKLVWFRRSGDCAARLARPEWGPATRFGSACPALVRPVAAG